VRTFLALDFDAASVRRFESVGATLRSADEAPADLGALRWTPRNNLHLTVKFLGEVPETAIATMAAELPLLARAAGPIRTLLRGVIAFPSSRRAEAIVTDVADADGHLEGLFRVFERLAAAHGVPAEERPYRPHVTLARARQPFDARAWLSSPFPEGLEIACPSLALYRSDRLEHGSVYTAIARAALRA
jgi:2'-5' RNA ligase